MRIAVLSDSHDQIPNLHAAVTRANRAQADVLIHCGDLISPFMLRYLSAFEGPVHLIYGNNVGDQHLISSRCGTLFPNISHHGTHGQITLGDRRIAFVHYPRLAKEVAQSGVYHLVCYGHDHIFHSERLGSCLLLNPGDLLGKEERPSFALVDLELGEIQREYVGSKLVFETELQE
nr:YfcE family phosphodiesterase [uncultured Desulfobulbus sp.]